MTDQITSVETVKPEPGSAAPSSVGAPMLTISGIAAAFGVASCCALPLMFASFGISATWLVSIAMIAVPYRSALLLLAAIALIAGAVLLLRQQYDAIVCSPGAKCVPASHRILTFIGLLVGLVLLWAGYKYV